MRPGDVAREIQDSLRLGGFRLVLASFSITVGVASIVALSAVDVGFSVFLGADFPSGSSSSPDAAPSLLTLAELAQLNESLANCRFALVAIALVSLLPGAVGLLGMMLSTVIERRDEMAMRRAMGACSTDIVRVFLSTSMVTCLVAGVIGIVFGSFLAFGVMGLMTAWQPPGGLHPVTNGGFLAAVLALCAVAGFVIGLYPAYRAANAEIVEASAPREKNRNFL